MITLCGVFEGCLGGEQRRGVDGRVWDWEWGRGGTGEVNFFFMHLGHLACSDKCVMRL